MALESADALLLNTYAKKTLEARWGERTVAFDIPVTGFSSFQLDRGTLRLLRQVEEEKPRWNRAMDLGCGYGTIAIHLAATGIAGEVIGVDRDALGVAFARRNAEKNKLGQCRFVGGLGYEEVGAEQKFDAILSNIPAKAGEPVHRSMLLDAGNYLNPGGTVAIVVVAPLEERIDAILTRDEIHIRKKVPLGDHIVYFYSFVRAIPPAAWPYVRGTTSLTWHDQTYEMDAVFGLPEFDTLSWDTEMVLDVAEKRKGRLTFGKVVVWNPGQGHIPVLLGKIAGRIGELAMLSRDALALRQSTTNAARNHASEKICSEHTVAFWTDLCRGAELCVGIVNDKEGLEVNVAKLTQVRKEGGNVPMIVGTPVSFGLRLEKALREHGVKATMIRKHQGNGVIECF